MATLQGNELNEYLINLEKETEKRISEADEKSFQHLMHSQMKEIINSEKGFSNYINSHVNGNGTLGIQPVLAITSSGLPSLDSLRADLETICQLSSEVDEFRDIAQKYTKGINGKNNGDESHLYVPVSEEEWNAEFQNRNKEPEKLFSKIGFSVNEVEDRKLELSVREDIYLEGCDKHSKEFPVMIREGKMKYHVVWNNLIEESEESFYIPNTPLFFQEKENLIVPQKKIFDDIEIFYQFSAKDNIKSRKERFFWFLGVLWDRFLSETFHSHVSEMMPNNYSKFLTEGTDERVRVTKNILETIEEISGKKIFIKGVNDLEKILSFSSVPFANAPNTILKEDDIYNLGNLDVWKKKCFIISSKYLTKFDLIYTSKKDRVGDIEYILPHLKRRYDEYSHEDGWKFTQGGIKLKVSGDFILNEIQDYYLKHKLKKVTWENQRMKDLELLDLSSNKPLIEGY